MAITYVRMLREQLTQTVIPLVIQALRRYAMIVTILTNAVLMD